MIRRACSLALFAVLACGTTPSNAPPSAPPRKSGFLSDYSRLERAAPTTLGWIDERALGRYTSFLIDPVETYFHDEAREKGREADWDDLKMLRSYTHRALREAIEGRYTVVARPGRGVARLRVALTDVDQTRSFMKFASGDTSGVSMEAELLDSVTGHQLAAIVEAQQGSSIPMKEFGRNDECTDIIDYWVQRFRARLDSIHGTE